jgi:hypothetical protein
MTTYAYTMKGTAAGGQTWETSGAVEVAPGDFPDVTMLALKDTFMKLTQGKAVFGQPGVGCKGPYSIVELTLKKAA